MKPCNYGHGIYMALDEKGERVPIERAGHHDGAYYCQICHSRLIPKKGNVRVHHYAHERGASCETWVQPMSDWHRKWQQCFPEDSREVVLSWRNEVHRADVYLEEERTVVEFQHSPLSTREFAERNLFYTLAGRSIVWVFDVSKDWEAKRLSSHLLREVQSVGTICDNQICNSLEWKWANKVFDEQDACDLARQRVTVVLQLGEQSEELASPLAWVIKSNTGFSSCDVVFISIEEFLKLVTDGSMVSCRSRGHCLTYFQERFFSEERLGFLTKTKSLPYASIVVLRRSQERRITAVLDTSDDAVWSLLGRCRVLAEHYDVVDVVLSFQSLTWDGKLVPMSFINSDSTIGASKDQTNFFLVLGLSGSVKDCPISPLRLKELMYQDEAGVVLRVWLGVAWKDRVPASKSWIHEETGEQWCWPFVQAPGSYISLLTHYDGEKSFTLDACRTYPIDTYLDDVAQGKNNRVVPCRYETDLHVPISVGREADLGLRK